MLINSIPISSFQPNKTSKCGLEVWRLQCTSTPQTTSPVVSSGSSEDEVVVIVIENGGDALLAGSEHLVAPGPTLAEVPAAPVFAG